MPLRIPQAATCTVAKDQMSLRVSGWHKGLFTCVGNATKSAQYNVQQWGPDDGITCAWLRYVIQLLWGSVTCRNVGHRRSWKADGAQQQRTQQRQARADRASHSLSHQFQAVLQPMDENAPATLQLQFGIPVQGPMLWSR